MDHVTHEESKTVFDCSIASRKNIQKDWRDELKVNDILITKSGDLRVIRHVTYYADGTLSTVTCAIRRCSWTGKATTMFNRSELKTLKFRKAEVKFKPKEWDVKFTEYVKQCKDRKPSWQGEQEYTCLHAKLFA